MNDKVLQDLYQVILSRKADPQEGSYTCYLFDKGLDKILKKVGEECAETIIAAKNGVQEQTVGADGGGDLRPHLPPAGDDGLPADSPHRRAGGTGAPQP